MRTAKVMVLPYDRAWKAAFEAIKMEIERAIGDLVIGIEHVGSTSVEGLSAKSHLMTHHLYVCPRNARELHRHITFRDYLRSQPEAVKQYGAVKEEGARRFPDDIEGYIAHKTPCIEEIYRYLKL